MIIKEISCKTGLSPSLLPGYEYALNPYRGCAHACIYCYAPAVLREHRGWGSFVDVKINIPLVLSKEAKTKKKGVVGISTVTDGYQPIEEKYEITRHCLEILLKNDFPVCIQTKSSLVLRDLDVIKQFKQKEVGFTITTLDDKARKKYEPCSSPIGERLSALKKLANEGIETWVFIGPIIPYITDENLEKLIEELAKIKVKAVLIDKLRIKPGLKEKIENFYSAHYSEFLQKYKETDENYYQNVKNKIIKLCKEYELKAVQCF